MGSLHGLDRVPFQQRWRVPLITGTLALGWLVIYLDRSILFPLLPVIAQDFGLSGAQQGAISSAYFLVYVIMQVPSGMLGDRLGLKRVITAMYLIIGLGLVGIGLFSVSYALLLLFVALHGFGAGAFYSGSYGITISTVPPEQRGLSTAVVTGGMASGFALGLALAGALYTFTGSWRTPFLIMALPTFLMVVLLLVAIGGVPPAPREEGGLKFLFRNRSVMCINVAAFCALYGYWVVMTWGPSYFHEELGLSISRAGLYTSVVALVSLPAALLWGRLSDRVGRKRLSLTLFLVASLMVLAIPFVGPGGLLLLVLVAYGLFGALAWNPVMVAWVGDHTFASGRVGMGTVMGILNTAAMSSSFVAPVVSGWIRDLGSLEWAFYLAALVYLVGLLFALVPGETVVSRQVSPTAKGNS